MASDNPTRLHSLDGLRGLAALGVSIFWHYQHFTTEEPPYYFLFKWLYDYGDTLVDFFFVISGFIFVYIYEERIREKSITAKEFILKRWFRLYPLHLITLLMVAVGQYLYFLQTQTSFIYKYNDLFYFILNLGLVQYGVLSNVTSFNGPSWTIVLEIISYITFFICLRYFSKIKPLHLYTMLAVGGALLGIFRLEYLLLNFQVGRGLSGFFVGAITFHIYQVLKQKKKETREGFLILSLIISLFGIYLITVYKMMFLYPLVIFPTIVLLSLLLRIFKRIFSLKVLRFLGSISYSIYLWHFPIQLFWVTLVTNMTINLNYASPMVLLFYTLITIAVSAVSNYAIEQPMYDKLKNKFL